MKTILIAALMLLVTACQDAPGTYQPGPFDFAKTSAPTRISVAKIEFLDHYQSPMKRPNVEQDFLVTPQKAVELWLDRRLMAAGSSGTLQVAITDASVVETPLKKTDGIKGLFTDDQDARYDARIAVTFRIYDGSSLAPRATADVEIKRFITLNEKATVQDRQRRYHEMLQAMMVDFDREASARLQQYFAGFVGS